MKELSPRFPLYIPTKSRHDVMMTNQALSELGLFHYLIVENEQIPAYRDALKRFNIKAEIIELDPSFKEKYELCDDLGLSRSTGPGPARNCAWAHAISKGHAWHWVMDDNIRAFRRLHQNEKVRVASPSVFRAMEDFCLRYANVGMAGPNYHFFAKARQKIPPFILNTRIYSCNLIRNDLKFRWRGRYNEDTILSLDMLKAGLCTVQFNAFLQEKQATQTVKGGNTEEFYFKEGVRKEGERYALGGTDAKSAMLIRVHPDCCWLVHKFKRTHHHVDYKRFSVNKLKKRPDLAIQNGDNNYGMTLKQRKSVKS